MSKLTGLSEYTLRFYEKQKLIKNISRDKNGYGLNKC
ncbi:MerR family DNA-binding transcriptional regulator [Clostridium hydrogenum]|nr:MerR family DNA-binding transcriptional regulator [Clostridium hydrogenum]